MIDRSITDAPNRIDEARYETIRPDQAILAAVKFLLRQKKAILASLVVTQLAAGLYLAVVRSTYTSSTTIIIDARRTQTFQSRSTVSEMPIDVPAVESQVEIIKSNNIARAVIGSLNLAQYDEFTRYGGGILGNALYYGYAIFDWNDEQADDSIDRRVLREFSRNLSARRVGPTYVIEISYRSANAERAAQIANAVANAYLAEQLEAKYQSARRAGAWLAERIQEMKQQTSAAEKSVADFKIENKIVDVGGRPTFEQQVGDLNVQLLTAQTQVTDARAKFDRIQQIMQSNTPEATVTDTLRSEVVSKLRSQYLDIANREADISGRYGASHLAAVNLRNQMREIGKSIKAELSRLAETYRSELQIATQRETDIQATLQGVIDKSQVTRQAQVQLKELESNSQTYRTLYESILQKNAEAIQQQTNPISEARIVSTANAPFKRSSPSTVLTLFVGLVSGLMFGIGLGLLRDLSTRGDSTALLR